MKRKFFALAVLLVVCAIGLSSPPVEATTGSCTLGYCKAHPDQPCICPPGTKLAGTMLTCPSTQADCNLS